MEERRNEILRELDRKGRVKVTDLSKEFGCSEVTIRNDIKAMDIEGSVCTDFYDYCNTAWTE